MALGFASGFGQGAQIEQNRQVIDLNRQQVEQQNQQKQAAAQQQMIEKVQTDFENIVTQAEAMTRELASQGKIETPEGQQMLMPLVEQIKAIGEMATQAGAPVDLAVAGSRLQLAATAPTQAQMIEQKANEERATYQARAEGTAAGTPPAPQTETKVIDGDSMINRVFGLGIPSGQSAKVTFEVDGQGNPVKADVVSSFGGAQTIINLGDRQQTAGMVKLAELNAQMVQETRNSATKARDDMVQIQQIRASVESGGFETGAIGETRMALSQWATLLGFDPQEIPGLGDAATAESLEAASSRLALSIAENFRTTNMSLQMARNAVPGLLRTKPGNAILTEILERDAEMKIARARFQEDFIAKHNDFQTREGRTLQQEMYDFDEKNPVVTDEMMERIRGLAKGAPASIKEVLSGIIPAGVPKGSRIIGQLNGKDVYETPDGRQVVAE